MFKKNFFNQDYSRTLKRELNNQYQQWREQIANIDLIMGDSRECRRIKNSFDNDIIFHRYRLEVAVTDSTESEDDRKEFKLLIEELDQFENELYLNHENIRECIHRREVEHQQLVRRLQGLNDEEQRGLTAQRIQQFDKFQADESFVGDQCVICIGDIEIIRNMMRLDCDGQHTFCQVCIEGWFAIKKTCPICRHVFQ